MNCTLITGGAKGLGAAICQSLAKQGHSLIIHYNESHEDAKKLKSICEGYGVAVYLVQGAFSSKESVSHILSQVDKLNVPVKFLINNVGQYLIKSLLETSEDNWYDLFQVNVHAPFLLTKQLSDSIIRQQGSILNIGVAGLETRQADTYSSAYTITKQALLGVTKSLAKELAPQHVTVNMISPGYLENSVDLPKELASLPMRRPVGLEEVTSMVNYLLSDAAKNITGQNIEIAGGVRI